MLYRCKFVTNSSSSSYIGWGYKLDEADLEKLTNDQQDELYDMWEDGPQRLTFIDGDGGPSGLVCLIARYSSEDFIHFLTEEHGADKLAADTVIRNALKKYGIVPKGLPCWVFSHAYG